MSTGKDDNTIAQKFEKTVIDSLTFPGDTSPEVGSLFSPEFLENNSGFGSFEEFVSSYDGELDLDGEGKSLTPPDFDDHVRKNTDFASWQEMRQQAEVDWMNENFN